MGFTIQGILRKFCYDILIPPKIFRYHMDLAAQNDTNLPEYVSWIGKKFACGGLPYVGAQVC